MEISIKEIIDKIEKEQIELGLKLYRGASSSEILSFQKVKQIKLPNDVVTFYSFCNGFESDEDMFRIIPLKAIIEEGRDEYLVDRNDFHFAEYMIYCDMWTMSINPLDNNDYTIYNKAKDVVILTKSFSLFLNYFLKGGVFEGLYAWRDKVTGK